MYIYSRSTAGSGSQGLAPYWDRCCTDELVMGAPTLDSPSARRAVVDNPTRQACGKNLRKPARKLHFGLKTSDFARSFCSKWSFYEVFLTVRLLKYGK